MFKIIKYQCIVPIVIIEILFNFKGYTQSNLYSKNTVYHSAISVSTHQGNFDSFTPKYKTTDNDWTKRNKASLQHPDADYTDEYAPSPTAVELFEKRTRNSKCYVDKDHTSKQYILQSIGAIHYRKNGQWLTIDERLDAKGNNLFEASHQEEPVGFDIGKQVAYIKSLQGTVQCNQWELYGETNGKDTLLAKPDWSHYTAGDEGLYITNIFPDIDAEMKVGRGTIETNFIVHKNNFATAEKLIFNDSYGSDVTGNVSVNGNGNEAQYFANGKPALQINEAVVYKEQDAEHTMITLPYTIVSNRQSTVSFAIATKYLNANLANGGTVIINPLVSTTNSLAQAGITGSMDCGSTTNSCNYTLQVPSPAKTTITGIYFQFGFQTVGTALNRNGYWTISSETGNTMFGSDPTNPTKYNSPGTTSTQGQFADISAAFLSAMPAPSCVSQNIPFTLGFFNNLCGAGSSCSNNFIKANQPFIVLIEGYTVDIDSISPAVSICNGASTILNVAGKYGVPPYTYAWSNGAGSTSSVTVAPTVNTSYQVTITDQCGNTATSSVVVSVKPVSVPATPVVGSNSPVCEGGTLSLTASSITGVTYAWTGANGFTSNLQNPTKLNADVDASGTYSVTAFANGCSSVPANVNVTVNSSTVAVSIQANAMTICTGTLASFTALPTNGGTAPTYQWKVNGSNVGTNSSTFSSSTLKNKDLVTCGMISNAGGCIPATTVTSNSISFEAIKTEVAPVGSVVDIDGNSYKTVVIGTQEWMAANLNTTKYYDGSLIPNVTDDIAWSSLTTGAYCNNNNLASNAVTYGRLYNWYAVNTGKLCPSGWHVPSDDEWTTLQNYLIASYGYDEIAKSMASTTGWASSTTTGTIGNNPSTNNKSGFTALPGGYRDIYNRSFYTVGSSGYWWSSTEYSTSNAYFRYLVYIGSLLGYPNVGKGVGFSVRCLRDFDVSEYLPIVLKADTSQVCLTNTVTLTTQVCGGTAPYTYTWSSGGANNQVITVSPVVSTKYSVSVSDASGYKNIDSIFITVKQPSSSMLTQTVCDSYTLNGQTYTSSGTYNQTFTNKAGCDSTITLNLTVNIPTSIELARTACSSYDLNGQTYTTSGTYTQTLTNKAGCDSTITLHLTISNNSPTTSTITASACKNYTLNGYLYDSSGTYMQTMKNVEGCDSTITLHLSINANKSSLIKTACNSYTLNGQTYTTSGIYTQTLVNVEGCDSIITLHLTINQPSSSTTNASICLGESYTFNGQAYTVAGTFTVHLTNMSGCDSTVTLVLTVYQPSSSITNVTICQGDSYTFNGNAYTTAGTYTVHLTNAVGCDSAAILVLTIKQTSSSTTNASICQGESYTFNGKVYTTSGSFTAHLTNSVGCDSAATLVLVVNQPSNSTTNVSICRGDSFTFNGTAYNTPGTYTAHFTNTVGCDSTAFLNLYIKIPIVLIPETINLCLGDQTPQITEYSGTDADSILWFDSNNQLVTKGITVILPNFKQTGTYTYKIKAYNGDCKNVDATNTIIVLAKPTPLVTGSHELCKGITSPYTLQNMESNSTVTWYLDNVSQSAFNNQQQASLAFPQAGIHTVKVDETLSGCTGTDTLNVLVSDIPRADFTFSSNAETLLATFNNTTNEIQLNDTISVKNSYWWQFETGGTKVPQTLNKDSTALSHQYATYGEFPVTLWVTNSYGCRDSVTKTLAIDEPPALLVPTAFSPNGDGINDILYAKGRSVENVSFVIYDRWGQKVFESNSLSDGWDGTFKGRVLETATFMYSISAISIIDGKKIEVHGNVTLVR